MAIAVWEKPQSGPYVVGKQGSDKRHFVVDGTTLRSLAYQAVYAVAPSMSGGYYLQQIELAEVEGSPTWNATCSYGVQDPAGNSFEFETGGGETKVLKSLATVGTYTAPGKTAEDYKQLIGVKKDGASYSVEGCSITLPAFHFGYGFHPPLGAVTPAYINALFYLTGSTNSAPFKGFARGEVLFLGASGKQQDTQRWDISLKFAASPNVTFNVGNITGIHKGGWQYVWYQTETVPGNSKLIEVPIFAKVEQVYPEGNFALLGIGT